MNNDEKRFEEFVGRVNFDDKSNPDHRDRLEKDLLDRLEDKSQQPQINIWRMIMKAKLAKLAAAAVIVIAVTFGLTTIIDKAATPAYAIEQTIEAMKNISTVHMVCRDWDDNPFEVWLKLDPETGKETHLYGVVPSSGTTIISEPDGNYIYD